MRRRYVLLAVLVLGLAGCGSSGSAKAGASAAPSKAPPPKVPGKLLVMAGNGLKLLTQEADGHLSSASAELSAVDEYEVAADHRTIAYRKGGVIGVRDLADGTDKQLAKDSATNKLCLRISPDAKRISYRRVEDLVVVDLAGKVTVLDKIRKEKYSIGGVGSATTASSELTCGEWLDATHVTFDRRKSMPQSITVDITATSPVVDADTTTVAVLGGRSPKLLDSPGMWHPTATCGNWVAANNGTNKDALHLRQRTGDGDVAKTGFFAGADVALPGTAGSTHAVVFVPGSCRPLLYTVEPRTFQAIDPATRAVTATPAVTLPSGGSKVRVYDDPAIWQPAPNPQALAVAVDKQIAIVDVQAGTVGLVPADGLDAASLVVAWLP
ncbi:hypothetical protein Daura_34820 [Dactylosporangium aurantiacum]|uniref:Lipoprotein n=1 Tax=Dactylosporangium aurantiacum TaxID=35754 RepID=A0A9Q9ICG9_9ACTN|nr:hypothetical protein [Dactylosporangium aurantiacum]MDG6103652.1 hypothetical protein [Dactylosporangium aurantiacum]UWZ51860.1 hypothetical protein Daura_34820 [Dactylosporangium aurantiacum]